MSKKLISNLFMKIARTYIRFGNAKKLFDPILAQKYGFCERSYIGSGESLLTSVILQRDFADFKLYGKTKTVIIDGQEFAVNHYFLQKQNLIVDPTYKELYVENLASADLTDYRQQLIKLKPIFIGTIDDVKIIPSFLASHKNGVKTLIQTDWYDNTTEVK